MSSLPEIVDKKSLFQSRLFNIEEVHLKFENGAERVFERLRTRGHGAVMVIPLVYPSHIYLIREYAVGIESYILGFPKGVMEHEEPIFQAANRELQEEIGFAARHFEKLISFSFVPSYMNHQMHLLLATDLYPQQLIGDEPEPLEVIKWPLEQLDELFLLPDFNEARSIAALFLLKERLRILRESL